MRSLEARIKVLEENTVRAIIYNVYYFHPELKRVYREVGNTKVYMDYEDTMNLPYTFFQTMFFSPDVGSDDIGTYVVAVGGEDIING
mgnify:CR=1 FL=1